MIFNKRHALTGLLLLAALFGAAGCREAGQQMDVQPGGRLDNDAAPPNGPVQITYIWKMAVDAEPVSRDYFVFAHFRGEDGEIRWQDDHTPPVPTSQWQPGQTVEYSRIQFVPDSAPLEQITLTVGLFDPGGSGEKVGLAGGQTRESGQEVARFEVIPADHLPIIIFDEGWYNPEFGTGQQGGHPWRWCRQEAVCWVEAPDRPCALYLDIQSPMQPPDSAQPVTLELEGTELASFFLTGPQRVARKIPLPGHLMEGRECVRLVLRTDRVVRPLEMGISDDERELGLKVRRLAVY